MVAGENQPTRTNDERGKIAITSQLLRDRVMMSSFPVTKSQVQVLRGEENHISGRSSAFSSGSLNGGMGNREGRKKGPPIVNKGFPGAKSCGREAA